VNTLIDYLAQKKVVLVDEWSRKTNQISDGYRKLSLEEISSSASLAFDAFCDIFEHGNFEPMDSYIQWLTSVRTAQGISLAELQEAFSNFRYTLFPKVHQLYRGQRLLEVLTLINVSTDKVIFRFSEYFRGVHEEELKTYADRLEWEVKVRTRELEESRRNYLTLVEGITDGCFLVFEKRLIYVNRAFCDMHGYSAEELLQKQWSRLIAKDSRNMVLDNLKKQIEGKDHMDRFVYYRQDRQRRLLPTEIKLRSLDYDGKRAVLGLCADISDRLEIEEKLRQQDRLALIGKLTSSIAHEIRNPLSAIRVNTELLLDKIKLEGNDLRRMQIICEQSLKLEDIIADILNFAKPLKLNYSLVSVYYMVDSVIELIKQRMGDQKVLFVKKMAPNLPRVMADEEKLFLAMMNIVTNAVEAIDEKKNSKKLQFTAQEKNLESVKYIQLGVRDNGKGIEAEDMENIFEPFFTKGKRGGVGLGLANVKRIVEAHHGHLLVKSWLGRGTVFEVVIPVDLLKRD